MEWIVENQKDLQLSLYYIFWALEKFDHSSIEQMIPISISVESQLFQMPNERYCLAW